MPEDKKENRADLYYTPISIGKILPSSVINCDLFLRRDDHYVLYRHRKIEITYDDLRRLADNRIDVLYIHNNDRKNFRDYLESNIENVLKSEQVPLQKKAEMLYESAVNVVEDVFENPRSGETIQRSKKMVTHTVDFILSTPRAFVNLLKIREHDFYTYTHSVNVCTFLVSLAQYLKIADREILQQIGEGGLLHDLGKSRVPAEIINKNGPLNKAEWDVMKQHPTFGVEIAQETRQISEVSLQIIGQHHEKISGTGYPKGLKGDELSIYARMASIIDVYDAVTTNRSYSQARTPLEAAKILISNKDHFDQKILEQFFLMMAVK